MTTRLLKRAILVLAAVVLAGAAAKAAETPRWNVLFLMSDDLRTELGCYGHPTVKTPHIDALAADGVKFDRAYVQYPLCNPSRTSLLTGRYPSTTGVLDNRRWFGALQPQVVSLPRHFRRQGYAALRCGKIFHGGIDDAEAWTEGGEPRSFEGAISDRGPRAGYQQNSDRWVVLEGDGQSHRDYQTATQAIDYLQRYRDKPFFLACGFTKPHSPPTAPQRFFDMYDPATIRLPPDFAPRPTVPPGFPQASVPPVNGDLFINRDAQPEEARKMIQAYWASLTWVDWNVGRVLAELDRLGLRDKTIILFWGDHGYHLGEKGKWSKHGSLFEVGTRVPLIVRLPGAAGNGHTCRRVVETLDLYPTLVELCGLEQPEGLEGDSLASLLEDPQAEWDKPAISMIGRDDETTGVMVRSERWRYVEYTGPGGGVLLVDAQADPRETVNLADDPRYAAQRAELAKLAAPHLRRKAR